MQSIEFISWPEAHSYEEALHLADSGVRFIAIRGTHGFDGDWPHALALRGVLKIAFWPPGDSPDDAVVMNAPSVGGLRRR